MSRKARSRALLRNLRKQARRGNLSALERKQLLQQEKRFRKGRSGFRKGLGAGLGAGLGVAAARYLTSPAFKTLLESRPTLDELMGRLKKEGVPEDKVEEVANTVKDADKDATPAEIVQEVEEKVAPADAAEEFADQLELERMDRDELLDPRGVRGEALGDDELIRDLEAIEEDPEAPIDDELARASLMDPEIFDSPNALRSDAETGEVSGTIMDPDTLFDPMMDPESAVVLDFGPDSVSGRPTRATNPNQRSFMGDALADLAGRSLDDPRMEALRRLDPDPMYDYVAPPGEGTAVSQGRDAQQQAQNQLASERMQDALDRGNEYNSLMSQIRGNANTFRPMDEFGLSEEQDMPLEFGDAYMPLQGIEEFDTPEEADIPLEDFPTSTRRQRAAMAREAARQRARSRRAGEDGIPVRTSGPRVQAMGGKNPKMADLMKKVKAKYGIR